AADSDAVDGGDDGLGGVPDDAVQGFDFEQAAVGRTVVTGLHALLLVTAGTEGLFTGAGEGDSADFGAAPGGLEGLDEFVDGAGAEGVVAVRPVDRDPGEPVVDLVCHVRECGEISHRPAGPFLRWWLAVSATAGRGTAVVGFGPTV